MIESIKVKVGGKTIKLTLEEAKELKSDLELILGKEYMPAPITEPLGWPKPPLYPHTTPFGQTCGSISGATKQEVYLKQ